MQYLIDVVKNVAVVKHVGVKRFTVVNPLYTDILYNSKFFITSLVLVQMYHLALYLSSL